MLRPARDRLLSTMLPRARQAASWRWLPVLLLAGVATDDALLLPRAPSYAVLGLLDEPAHLATSGILLASLAAGARRAGWPVAGAFAAGLLAGGNLIDADHVPAVLGWDWLTRGTPRPYSHALLTVALLGAAAVAAHTTGRRRGAAVAAGLAAGVTGHLFRDLGTAPVALLWPFSDRSSTIPHGAYLLLLGLTALSPAVLRPAAQVTSGRRRRSRAWRLPRR
jgi:inner membrane protein